MNHAIENSLVAGAQQAYEATNVAPCPQAMLDKAVIDLEVALAARELSPIVAHAKQHILDCALDDYEVIEAALMQTLTDPAEAGHMMARLMDKHIKNYVAGHASTLIEHFKIAPPSLLRGQAA